jgi:hypothetical protein
MHSAKDAALPQFALRFRFEFDTHVRFVFADLACFELLKWKIDLDRRGLFQSVQIYGPVVNENHAAILSGAEKSRCQSQ